MEHRERLEQILRDPRIWQAGRKSAAAARTISTCWVQLDEALGGGWPLGQLTELLPDAHGFGEFSLLMPALILLSGGWKDASGEVRGEHRRDSGGGPATAPGHARDAEGKFSKMHAPARCFATNVDSGWVMLIAPPHVPYAPAFAAHGFDVSRLLVVRTRRQMDVLWAMEQALRSGTCAAVVAWSASSDERALRRLQLAAEEGGSLAVVFRPPGSRECASPAALRMRLSGSHQGHGLRVQILRQRHGPPTTVRVDI